MNRTRNGLLFLALFAIIAVGLRAQDAASTAAAGKAAVKDVDPLAMRVLKAVADPVQQAQSFSFKALVSEEDLASNGQLITTFHAVEVTVQRPDKIHVVFRGSGQRVDYYGAPGGAYLYAPDPKLYVSLPGRESIDAALDALKAKDIDVPIGPFLRSNFYALAEKLVNTAYVIGRVKIGDQDVHQLAFTSDDADWQLWVVGGDAPRFVRAEIINKNIEGTPRTTIQFLDWNLNPTLSADDITFNKPADASQIEFIAISGGN
ncbi:DUF2092 domain-containing protein [Occallatibacter riparius]|uniref:DUF2092 domain-containing protein n=1 Tax=Occallatibacter riparius TaxID=1002689 RepID=A0A9J7BQW4_9BACT|nr:DUF2092 domain-containing protein [Occallatibacter riparius]UWZ83326.1 DUF2092 domain-containing protein [Occallatibacter riparius]